MSSLVLSFALLGVGLHQGSLTSKIRPGTVAILFVEAVDVGDSEFERLIDFGAFHRNNAAKMPRCTAAEARKRFIDLVMLPVRHRAAPGRAPRETNDVTMHETVDGTHASVDVRWAPGSGRTLTLAFKLDLHPVHGWRITDMQGWFERDLFESCRES